VQRLQRSVSPLLPLRASAPVHAAAAASDPNLRCNVELQQAKQIGDGVGQRIFVQRTGVVFAGKVERDCVSGIGVNPGRTRIPL
jgi:hypothetical protein